MEVSCASLAVVGLSVRARRMLTLLCTSWPPARQKTALEAAESKYQAVHEARSAALRRVDELYEKEGRNKQHGSKRERDAAIRKTLKGLKANMRQMEQSVSSRQEAVERRRRTSRDAESAARYVVTAGSHRLPHASAAGGGGSVASAAHTGLRAALCVRGCLPPASDAAQTAEEEGGDDQAAGAQQERHQRAV